MDRIYVVFGRTGEYDDAREWPVRAWEEKDDADAMAQCLNEWCEENQFAEKTKKKARWDGPSMRPHEDPQFSCAYTGTDYCVYEVPFGPASEGAA